ncbi:hypothetical protein H6F93_27790 [Leptolyngbya sp. FACHB-671]|uniref:hypothetical protein n=1 Tax=Leptolyngbya sp. FACHB-671 TaxID=2692812 RepID=UPI00168815BC|nr:hypothetical protein [Leptolyngbya sp. FACHB-671]MBD2071272.1 hypothetical protein [Leptolyngbya sp. FACHB-671]
MYRFVLAKNIASLLAKHVSLDGLLENFGMFSAIAPSPNSIDLPSERIDLSSKQIDPSIEQIDTSIE